MRVSLIIRHKVKSFNPKKFARLIVPAFKMTRLTFNYGNFSSILFILSSRVSLIKVPFHNLRVYSSRYLIDQSQATIDDEDAFNFYNLTFGNKMTQHWYWKLKLYHCFLLSYSMPRKQLIHHRLIRCWSLHYH